MNMKLQRLNEDTPENQQILSWIQKNVCFPPDVEDLLAHQNIKADIEMDIAARLSDALPELSISGVRVANEIHDSLWRMTIHHTSGVFDADFVPEAD